MADSKKISELTALASGSVDYVADLLPIVDVSVAVSLRNKNITADALVKAALAGNGITVTSGALSVTGSLAATTTITAGTGLTVTTGGATITAGGLTVTAGAVALGATSDFAINTNKFTVAAASGNTVVAGTLTLTGLIIDTGGATNLSIKTNAGTEQVRITHTASATRYITLTGSNGGNPAIGASAGNVNITAALIVTGSISSATANSLGFDYNGSNANRVISYGPSASTGTPLTFLIVDSAGNAVNAGAEAARITAGGYFKASNSGTYDSATGSYHELITNSAGTQLAVFRHTNANPFGVYFAFSTDSNDTAHPYWSCLGNATTRAELRSNGGLANFSANNVNLSDRASKFGLTVYDPSELDAVAAAFDRVDFGVWKYKDQTHEDWNHGPTVQGVEEAFDGVTIAGRPVLDSLIDTFDQKRGLKGLITHDFANLALAALLHRVRKLEAAQAASAKLK